MSEANILQNHFETPDASVDFLIITALEKELKAVYRQLGDYKRIQKANFPTYYRATLETNSGSDRGILVVAVTMVTQNGNTPAAVRTTRFVQHLKPRYVLMVGIAGGIKGKVNLGDVVVSNKIIYYEYTKETPSGSEPRIEVKSVDSLLLDRAMNCDTDWHTLIHAKRPFNSRSTEVPRFHAGPVACGEKVIANDNRVSELKQLDSKLLAIEMESFGVAAAVADSADRPGFIAFRGVCDYADHQKDDVWQEYAADSAAAFTIGLLRSGAISVSDSTQSVIRKTLIAIRHQSMEPLSNRLGEASLPEALRLSRLVNIEIDQTDLYDNGRLTNPVEAARRHTKVIHQLSEALNTNSNAKLVYYGIAHIPLLFHVGCQILTRTDLHFFEYNRITNQWNLLQREEDYPRIMSEGLPDIVTQKAGDVVVRISISYPVTLEAIEGIVTNPIASVHLSIDQPKIDVVTSMNQLEQYSVEFRDTLDEICKKLPNTECLHIFYAGPVALAVNFGRLISRTIHPRIIVYNYSSKDNPPGYAWGLEVTADVNSPNFLKRVGG